MRANARSKAAVKQDTRAAHQHRGGPGIMGNSEKAEEIHWTRSTSEMLRRYAATRVLSSSRVSLTQGFSGAERNQFRTGTVKALGDPAGDDRLDDIARHERQRRGNGPGRGQVEQEIHAEDAEEVDDD